MLLSLFEDSAKRGGSVFGKRVSKHEEEEWLSAISWRFTYAECEFGYPMGDMKSNKGKFFVVETMIGKGVRRYIDCLLRLDGAVRCLKPDRGPATAYHKPSPIDGLLAREIGCDIPYAVNVIANNSPIPVSAPSNSIPFESQ